MFIIEETNQETWVLHNQIDTVARGPLSAAGCLLTIKCKTFLDLHMLISRDKDCTDVYKSLIDLSMPSRIEDVYAFDYIPSNKNNKLEDGWLESDRLILSDYKRLGLPNEVWCESDLNQNYKFCDSYPEVLYVPKGVSKPVLIGSSKFRSRGRLPVLSYLYPKNSASICRCSQPLTGFRARCVEDEDLMQHILKTNPRSNVLYVVDVRPKINALANKAAGKGFENENNYDNMKFYFFPVENIHVMRASVQKLREACLDRSLTSTAFWSAIEGSGWFKHVKILLETSKFIAESILKSINVVVHCSDGWDRTAQTISLACILLDPNYRTLKGFQVLIERDWLMFGHKFADRLRHTVPNRKDSNKNDQEYDPEVNTNNNNKESNSNFQKEISPIFLQFLDCVHQLMRQYPLTFEFNERFLAMLYDAAVSCQFGTFLVNCQKDRRDLNLPKRTYSFWAHVEENRDECLNPIYCSDENTDVLTPDLRSQAIKLWRFMYNRFDGGVHPRESFEDAAVTMKDRIKALKFQANLLKRVSRSSSSHANIDVSAAAAAKRNSVASSKMISDSESGYDDEPSTPGQSGAGSDVLKIKTSIPHPLDGVGATTNFRSNVNRTDDDFTFALDWQKLRDATHCSSCTTIFDHFARKYHCWRCGLIFCRRCISRSTISLTLSGDEESPDQDRPSYCRNCNLIAKSA
uniref:phosphatidylinositol-3,5-bisphosphate 3-phosphatase n=1 Tax=Romanomermis culicivorax TaxID=13658 RepID=A0A915KWG7_ROMCU